MSKNVPMAVRLLSDYLSASGLSVEQLAREIGVATRTIYNWVSGETRCSLEGALAIESLTWDAVPARAWLDEAGRRKVASFRVRGQP